MTKWNSPENVLAENTKSLHRSSQICLKKAKTSQQVLKSCQWKIYCAKRITFEVCQIIKCNYYWVILMKVKESRMLRKTGIYKIMDITRLHNFYV